MGCLKQKVEIENRAYACGAFVPGQKARSNNHRDQFSLLARLNQGDVEDCQVRAREVLLGPRQVSKLSFASSDSRPALYFCLAGRTLVVEFRHGRSGRQALQARDFRHGAVSGSRHKF